MKMVHFRLVIVVDKNTWRFYFECVRYYGLLKLTDGILIKYLVLMVHIVKIKTRHSYIDIFTIFNEKMLLNGKEGS